MAGRPPKMLRGAPEMLRGGAKTISGGEKHTNAKQTKKKKGKNS
jgi:hypothetical protein